MGAFTQQLERIAGAMRNHEGPIVFAGDFDTWHRGRADTVARLAKELNLREVQLENGAPKTVFGYPLAGAACASTSPAQSGCPVPITTRWSPAGVCTE